MAGIKAVQVLCAGPGCDRAPRAKGLCQRHYKRTQAGLPLEDPLIARLGTTDGFGRFGYLDGGDKLLCHECGRRFAGLGQHVASTHGMTADEYRVAHGLAMSSALAGSAARASMSAAKVAAIGSTAWRRFRASRNRGLAAARVARAQGRGCLTGAVTVVARAEQRRASGLAIRAGRVWTCAVCGAQWSMLAGRAGRRYCGPACRRVDATARNKAAAAARYRELTAAETATLLGLRNSPELFAAIAQVVAAGVSQRRIAALLGLPERTMDRRLARWRANGKG